MVLPGERIVLCPYCLTEVHLTGHGRQSGSVSFDAFALIDMLGERNSYHCFKGGYCPKCNGAIVTYSRMEASGGPVQMDANIFTDVLFPKNGSLVPLPPEVPQEYREDFDEARLVLDLRANLEI
jgi:hypothetical protein